MTVNVIRNIEQGLALGASASISSSNLRAESTPAVPASNIVYTITKLPIDGVIRRGAIPLTIGSTFTQVDINSGAIRYSHDSSKSNLTDIMELSISNGIPGETPALIAFTFKITIPPVPPTGTISPLYVTQNETKKLSKDNINFIDKNNPGVHAEVLFEVVSLPRKGKIKLNGVEITRLGFIFTQEDINLGRLTYSHIKSIDPTAEEDSFFILAQDPQENKDAPAKEVPIFIELINEPLRLVNNGPLELKQGDTKTINDDLLLVDDPDTITSELIYTLLSIPENGQILLNGVPLVENDTFTQNDINAGYLSYEHAGERIETDSFDFSVTDGNTIISNTFPIIIELKEDNPPTIIINPLVVEQGGSENVDISILEVNDPEGLNPSDIKIKIIELPTTGTLTFNGVSVNTSTEISYQDILDSKLIYTHNGTNVFIDSFKISVSDEVSTINGTIPISIIERPNLPPQLDKNTVSTVLKGNSIIINTDSLSFSDPDTEPTQVFLKILTLPNNGSIKINNVDIVVGQQISLSAWSSLTYTHNNSDILEDSFDFELTDGTNIAGPYKHIIVVEELPVKEIPILTNTGIEVLKESTTVIDSSKLFATDVDTPYNQLIFTITSLPFEGKLLKNGEELLLGETFTSQDILENRISYSNINPNAEFDNFNFELTDGFNILTGTFTITILKGLQLINNLGLNIDRGSTKIINSDILKASNPTKLDSDIIFYIETGPFYGSILVAGSPNSIFTQQQINDGLVQYVHDNSLLSDTDQFTFTVTDGIENISANFDITINSVNQAPEIIVNNGIDVPENKCSLLSTSELSAQDGDNPDASTLIFELTSIPTNAIVTKNDNTLSIGDTFTQDDIINGRIDICILIASSELDGFNFTLTDGFDTTEVTFFEIRQIPPPPAELTNLGLVVEPCTERSVLRSRLRVSNIPEEFSTLDIVYTLTSVPSIGYLKKQGIILNIGDTFTQADIDSIIVTYENNTVYAGDDSFEFNWSVGNQSGSDIFLINILSINNPPWLGVLNGITVDEQGSKVITNQNLEIYDVDLDGSGPINIPPELNNLSLDTEGGNSGYNKVWTVEPGSQYSWNFIPTTGSSRFVMLNPSKLPINGADSTCTNTRRTGNVLIPNNITEITIQVQTNCAGSNGSQWLLSITKL